MRVFVIDDEPALLETLHEAVADVLPRAAILDFRRGREALAAVTELGERPDLVFSDIRMPDLDGLRLATEIKAASPDTRIIFTTAYSEYAMEAWKRHVNGYLLKPVTAADIREALADVPLPAEEEPDKLRIVCFGHFEVYFRGKPVIFERRQSKELLAFLVDREGAACTAEEIISHMWENETDLQAAKTRIRRLISDLKATLQGIGMDDVLIRTRRQIAIRRDRVDCDYYRMLEGDPAAINAWHGEYMVDYCWAEMTTGRLYFRKLE